jgi:hypothetical protein
MLKELNDEVETAKANEVAKKALAGDRVISAGCQ